MNLSPASQAELLRIARRSLRAALAGDQRDAPGGDTPPAPLGDTPPPQDPELLQPAGCFVSLHERQTHRLRGCIGRLESSQPLWQVVAETAASVLDDPRFVERRVTADELASLEIEISVLSPLTPAASATDFDLLSDGIYLIAGDRAGCFLPQVARETGWDKQQLLDRLCTEKLGLPSSAWRNPDATLLRFSTLIVGPEAA